ncbi:MAG: hypothetical protein F6K48_02965 [Okeania sp. SIO3H1]|nr:hypothetical protein [Okeania sp. SIO3H1]
MRKPSNSWVGFSNGRYAILTIPDKSMSALLTVVDENNQAASCFGLPWRADIRSILMDIFKAYSMPDIELGMRGKLLKDAKGGVWSNNKGMHILVAKALDTAWKWFKEKGSKDLGTNHQFNVKLPAGAIRKSEGVTYEGFTNRLLKAHSFASIKKTTDDAIRLCKATWGWSPKNLRVMVHNMGNAMGIAFSPGRGVHKISLHSKLLNEFDTMSIFRVILHEFCHHYREESFPSNPYDMHDSVFCRELKRVDSVLANDERESCTFFTDEKWKGSSVVQKQLAKREAQNFNPSEGFLSLRVLKSNEFRLDWIPNKQGGFKRKAMGVYPAMLKEIIGNSNPSKIVLTAGDAKGERYIRNMSKGSGKTTVKVFLEHLHKNYPSRGYGSLL